MGGGGIFKAFGLHEHGGELSYKTWTIISPHFAK